MRVLFKSKAVSLTLLKSQKHGSEVASSLGDMHPRTEKGVKVSGPSAGFYCCVKTKIT